MFKYRRNNKNKISKKSNSLNFRSGINSEETKRKKMRIFNETRVFLLLLCSFW